MTGALGIARLPDAPSPTPVDGDMRFTSISAGYDHTCAVRSNGELWCWGANAYGQLGTGDTTHRFEPTRVATSERFDAVSAGYARTCARALDDGQLRCWGLRWLYSDSGFDYAQKETVPYRFASSLSVSDVSVGLGSLCATSSAGLLVCWASNTFGQLGNGSTVGTPEPLAVRSGRRFRSVSVGSIQTCAVAEDLTGWCWGNNTFGQLGTAAPTRACIPGAEILCSFEPVPVEGQLRFTVISTGMGNHVCGITTLSNLYCWGLGYAGQRGDGTLRSLAFAPVRVRPRRS